MHTRFGYIKMHILSSTHATHAATRPDPTRSQLSSYRPNRRSGPLSIQRRGEGDAREAHVVAAALQELQGAPEQGLVGEHVLVGGEGTAGDGAPAAAVELPEGAVVRLDEADVVQVDVVAGVGGRGLALAGGLAVGGGEGRGPLEEGGALGGREGGGLGEEGR